MTQPGRHDRDSRGAGNKGCFDSDGRGPGETTLPKPGRGAIRYRQAHRRSPRFILGGPQVPPTPRSASRAQALRGARVPPVDSEDEPLPSTRTRHADMSRDTRPASAGGIGARPTTTVPSIRLAEGRSNQAIADRDQIDRSMPPDTVIWLNRAQRHAALGFRRAPSRHARPRAGLAVSLAHHPSSAGSQPADSPLSAGRRPNRGGRMSRLIGRL